MTFAHVYNKIENEDNTIKHKIIQSKRLHNKISFLLNSYFIIGNSKS